MHFYVNWRSLLLRVLLWSCPVMNSQAHTLALNICP